MHLKWDGLIKPPGEPGINAETSAHVSCAGEKTKALMFAWDQLQNPAQTQPLGLPDQGRRGAGREGTVSVSMATKGAAPRAPHQSFWEGSSGRGCHAC